jgi:PWWP domain
MLTNFSVTTGTAVNGSTEMAAEAAPTDAQPSELTTSTPAAATQDDAEMKDEPAPTVNTEEPEANGTPATSSKKQSNGKRKSTGGVPEHKSKKLNKKKSMQKITHLDAKPGDYYFARLKSYPPWPSIVCDEEMLPQSLVTTRPVTTKQQDGTYRADYADGGKKAQERTYPVMFLQTNEL